MLHPQYFRWTRNLVVASSFGLRLPNNKQNSFSAFRDSQQTEIFYNTKRLLAGNNLSNAGFSPVLFEIGRNGHVFLPQSYDDAEDNNIRKILPQEMSSQNQNYQQFSLLAGIALALIALLYGFRPNSKVLCIGIGSVAVIIFIFMVQRLA